ncbi:MULTISPECIES: monovalent cation:proton antiporter family protein [Rubrivivax]|uniref:Potassium transporter n=1 Tax=Rubrivivax benzoatilyticus TaxID=316997 RepID=A0ABX0HYQ4_9BURK|nr:MULTISPECIES: monovalent cation:proton antiporter family protein [Rubrivivax]MCD0421048.1 monovalent cation:proton antiporter-2 (CPA2) family protein [Rubrivivax sp. JA1024]EGJ10161.1 sodium/hydrogen exchanger [Rubrivivax benzoatilyticus JA2 = ATCC BAA-35]MCC9596732.1 monovalent cation:proton antiporter-2 (CPA2) family protein [Rubrivivax sp. JA1055]NHK98726.1 potassium transporter [Rubrivivax benzoatilyticus]NHL24228.1 potassium transporter [Rubrivivax benzoatilyticus]
MATTLELVLLYLVAAVLGVVVCRSLKLPPMLGYLVVGVLIGPNALALAQDSAGVKYLAEFGVVFLMFVIGLEFNLPKLRSMRTVVFGLGLSQVALTMIGTLAGHLLLAALYQRLTGDPWRMSWQGAVVLGGAIAMSSTAIVVKLMAERLELESEHGRRVMGILLFQDLAVVPLLVLIPALNSSGEQLLVSLGWAVLKAAGLLAVLLVGGQKVMRWWLTLVARRKSDELFILNLLLVTLGLAWLTEHAGLSLALGAFVAGMLVAETEYKHQVETDIRPFHDVLLGLFFITIGMKLDWRPVLDQWPLVLLLTTVPVAAKFALVAALARGFRTAPGVALRTGLYLAQAGEFGFVLLTLGAERGLVDAEWMSPILASMVLSMLATPFIIMHADRIVMKLAASDWLMQSVQLTSIAKRAIRTEKHVIICGYGRSGQNLARMLDTQHIPYMALDLDPDRVRQAAAAGQSVVFGDAARLQSLMAAGLARANAVVVSYPDTPSALKILRLVHEHAPAVPVIVRTIDDSDLETLRAAGATEVVPEAIEGSLMLASHALALVGVPMRTVIRLARDARDARYSLLRGYFHGADDDTAGDLQQERLATVTLPPAAAAIGERLADLALGALEVGVISVRRASGPPGKPADDTVLGAGDTLVLSGLPEALARAEQRLLRG